jgi:hypothetical protein
VRAGKIMSMKNSSDTIGKPTRNGTACSAVPQPKAPLVKWCKPYKLLTFSPELVTFQADAHFVIS